MIVSPISRFGDLLELGILLLQPLILSNIHVSQLHGDHELKADSKWYLTRTSLLPRRALLLLLLRAHRLLSLLPLLRMD